MEMFMDSSFAAYGASINHYSDSRLYGHGLVEPFQKMYNSWIRPINNPIHEQSNRYIEIGRRSCNALIGSIIILSLSILPVLGRLLQMIHYHLLSKESRLKPAAIVVEGIRLPKLQQEPSEAGTISIKKLKELDVQKQKEGGSIAPCTPDGKVMRAAVLPHELEFTLPVQTPAEIQSFLRGGDFSAKGNEGKHFQVVCDFADNFKFYQTAWINASLNSIKKSIYDQWVHADKVAINDERFDRILEKVFSQNGFRGFAFIDDGKVEFNVIDETAYVIKNVRNTRTYRTFWGLPSIIG